MIFTENSYLEWYLPRMQRGDGAINLHASGVPALGSEISRSVPAMPWAAARHFETALAGWLGCSPEEVLFAPGATGGTLLGLLALAEKGQRVLVEQPMYEPMVRQAERLSRVERFVRSPASGWRLPLDAIAASLAEDVAMVMVTEPHNPSGILSPAEDVLALAEMADKYGALVLVNEIYRGYSQTESFHGRADNIVVVGSLSKFFGTYWARLGYLTATQDCLARLRAGHVNMGMPTQPGAAAGMAVLEQAEHLSAAAVSVARTGSAVVDAWVTATPGISWHRPDGTGFGAVVLPDGMDDLVFGEHLHDNCGVLLVPGTRFEAPGTLRLSWLQAGERLEEGLKIIARELATW